MPIIFDGRAFAAEKILKLDNKVAGLKNRGIYPKLASILVGDDPAGRLYVSLKKKKAQSIGVEMDVYYLKENELLETILALIDSLNSDPSVYGIMVQLPLPSNFSKEDKQRIINSIKREKDVDGLREDSPYVHPTVMAVLQVIEIAKSSLTVHGSPFTVCVVGATGMVGSALLREIKNTDDKLVEKSEDADILVSATGSPNIIKANMVKKGAIVIDVGSPKGDVDPSVALRASFLTPVPGGIGPITISCLLENLVKASRSEIFP